MRSLLIGSEAARLYYSDWREPKDVDAFSDVPQAGVETFWHPLLERYVPEGRWVATPRQLYTIKLSHASWDLGGGSWEKHMYDAMWLKKFLDVPEVIRPFYDDLVTIWKEKHGSKRVNLDQDKSAFFGDAVQRKYDHDSLHRSVAFTPGYPIYERFLKDGSDVLMDMSLVWSSPYSERLDLFAEEIAATALERWVIPSDYKISPGLAWQRAVKKTIISLTKGRSSLFVAQNYDKYQKPTYNYVGVHKANKHLLEEL